MKKGLKKHKQKLQVLHEIRNSNAINPKHNKDENEKTNAKREEANEGVKNEYNN